MMNGTIGELLWWAVAKAPLVLVGALLTVWVLRGASAATRHRVWATAVIVTLALPLLSLFVPRVQIAVPSTRATTAVHATAAARPVVAAGPVRAAPAAAPRVAAVATGARAAPAPAASPVRADAPETGWVTRVAPEIPARSVAILLWVIVATGLLMRLVIDRVRTARFERMHVDVTEDELGRRVRAVAAQRGVRTLRVLRGPADAMPATWGARRPVLLLPRGAEGWPASRVEAVVRHELAHVARGDVMLQLLADVLCALHWFNPLAWYAAHRMRIEREHACDDEVLAAGARPSDYASQLVGLARRFREARVAGVAMARRGGLRERVESVLDERRRRGESRGARRAIQLAALLLALPLAAFTPRAAVIADGTPAAEEQLHFAAAPVEARPATAPRTAAVLPVFAVQLATLCWDDARDGASSVRRSNDDSFEMEWSRDDCRVQIRVEGDLRFSDDFSRIVGLSSGGRARFEERDGSRERRVEIRPSSAGIEQRWYVNGDEQPFDAEAQRWLDAILLSAFRTGGLAVEERAQWILRERGLDALLEEMEYLRGDWARGQYFEVALSSPDMDDTRAVRLVERAAATIGSDHTLMTILQTVAADRSLAHPELRAAFIDAAGSIGSDHARGRVLEAAIDGPSLPARDLAAIIDAISGIGSDHEKSQLLIAVARRHSLTPELRAAYLRVTASIGSDHSTGQAAHALLDAGDASADEMILALDVAREIGSDHERGELLRRLTSADLRNPDVRDRFETALSGIGSDHTLGTVLTDLMQQNEVDEFTANVVLGAARSINSDHTLGEVLTMLVRRGGVTADTQSAFDDVLDSIGSDHTRSEVERALRGR